MKMIQLTNNVAFKNNAPFRSCMSKLSSALMDNTEDLDIVMPMYNLLEYSKTYSVTSGSLWNYYLDEVDNINDNPSDGKSFKYKTKIAGKTPKKPARPGNPGDANQLPQAVVPALSV